MGTAYLRVNIDGQPLYEFSKDVLMEQVDVIQEINQHWWCHIRCRQTEDQRFPIEDSLGKDLQVIAFDEDDNQTYLFSGFVLEAELEYEIYGSYTARITGVSKTYNMDVAHRQHYYDYGKNTVDNVIGETTSRAGLSLNGSPPKGEFPLPLMQWGETDFNFLIRQLDSAITWVFPDAEKADVINGRSEFDDGPTLQWRVEDQLLSFRVLGKLAAPKMDGAHYNPLAGLSKLFENVKGAPAFLDGAGEMVGKVKEQSDSKLKPAYLVNRRGVLEVDAFKTLLEREVARGIETGVVATGVSLNPAVAAGKKVTIEGVTKVGGAYGVTKVVHHWTPQGYTNEFWCTASSQFRPLERPKSNPWYGVVVARVADNNDPEKLGRIKVQYIWQEQSPTFWARMMTPHAGHDRGIFFIPEIGDEVVVAFEDGDPERPIILGCLWNKTDPPPTEDFWGGGNEYKSDDVKRIVTKSGHRIQLVDKDGKESIVIATPTHLKISMIENSDENGRPTMVLHSDGDIFLDAPKGRIHCHSKFFSREVGE
jgi:type VI secretion system secreted protein VgrG